MNSAIQVSLSGPGNVDSIQSFTFTLLRSQEKLAGLKRLQSTLENCLDLKEIQNGSDL